MRVRWGGEGGRAVVQSRGAEADHGIPDQQDPAVAPEAAAFKHKTASTVVPKKIHARAASGILCKVRCRGCRHTCLVLALMLAPCSRSS